MVAMIVSSLVYLILAAPLAGLLINTAGRRRFPDYLTGSLATLAVSISAICSWLLFFQLSGEVFEWTLYTWIEIGLFSVDFGFYVDWLTGLMLITVTTVSSCVHFYSMEYMEQDDGYSRFFIYLNLFVFAMLVLVTASNLLMMFIGWEGVGLCSYLLIGFWYEKESARKAGRKAFIVNRIGDFCFLIGMFLLVSHAGTLHFALLEGVVDTLPGNVVFWIALSLFGGAVGKSAQFPLYVWLPDAMEGPTPVSSLIHAATMVTAGVYLIARLSFLYDLVPGVGAIIAVVGAFTALFAATMALVHPDMKRILAYSTVSQLGYMFVAVGLGSYAAGIFHLMTHAFFKGLLFLMAGSVMHGLSGELNIFKMGGLARSMPWTAAMAMIGGLGLAGIPPLAGFWSKDEILLATLREGSLFHGTIFVVLALGALLTAFYTFRMIFVAFWGRGETEGHECGPWMKGSMGVLAIGTILGGFFTVWTYELVGHAHKSHASAHTVVITTSVLVAILGVAGAYLIYQSRWLSADRLQQVLSPMHKLLDNQYYVDEIYRRIIVRPLNRVSVVFWRVLDEIIIDGGIRLGALMVEISGLVGRFIQTGYTRHYLFYLSGAIMLILSILGWIL